MRSPAPLRRPSAPLLLALLLACRPAASTTTQPSGPTASPPTASPPASPASPTAADPSHRVSALKITVLSTMLADTGVGEWGFAALVEADGRRILFDTGARPDTV